VKDGSPFSRIFLGPGVSSHPFIDES
jgi:hypothetical protein